MPKSAQASMYTQKDMLETLRQLNKNQDTTFLSPKNVTDIIQLCKKQKPNVLETNPLCRRVHDANSAIDLLIERLPFLLRAYNQKLIEQKLGLSEQELLSLNRIDIRNIYPANNKKSCEMPDTLMESLSEEELQFSSKNGLFAQIPCYDKGILQLNKHRYIYYEILNLDLNNKTIRIFIQDYFKDFDIWQIGISMVIEYGNLDCVKASNITTYPVIYKTIPLNKFKWSDIDKLIWKINIENSEKLSKIIEKQGYDTAESLTTAFMKSIVRTNYMLSLHKPSRGKRMNKAQSTKRIIDTNINTPQPDKLIRTVGPIVFQSKEPPKQPTDETVIHYKTASWTTRGHTRTLKSGKIVYVKESVHKRKCLQDKNAKTPQNIIQFKKPMKENEN